MPHVTGHTRSSTAESVPESGPAFDMLGAADIERLWSWNRKATAPMGACVHELFEHQAALTPGRPALASWDGEMTYGELDQASSRLGSYLVKKYGVAVEDVVAFTFEKSLCAVVAMMGIMKAGGVVMPLDPRLPQSQWHSAMDAFGARIAVTSPTMASRIPSKYSNRILSVDHALLSAIPEHPAGGHCSDVRPENGVLLVQSSGTTGKPKGILQEHEAFSVSCRDHGAAMHITSESRTYQFAGYGFDTSFSDMFCTFMVGGCVCLPSDTDRINDLAGSMAAFGATGACLTPSAAEALMPEDVPTLKVLALGGEPLSERLLERWAPHVTLINIYGVTECIVWCTATKALRPGDSPTNIGHAVCGRTWIVEAEDHTRLVPIGSVGELLIEGPNMARNYYGNPDLTRKAFVEMPAFFGDGHRRFYRTGDLVKYADSNGSIEYIGRRDTQIKLAGQRIDLAQIEHCMQQCVPPRAQVCVVLASERRVLVGLVCEKYCTKSASGKPTWTAEGLRNALDKLLPAYMIPGAFFEINRLPSTATGKIDRRRLAEMSSDLLMECSEPGIALDSPPLTESQELLQKLWVEVLGVRPERLHAKSNFLQLGDSVSAMKLANCARKAGLKIDVATVFSHPVLGDMANAAGRTGESESEPDDAEPFSLFGRIAPIETLKHARAAAAAQCGVPSSAIEDLYPSTPLQEGLMALSIKDPGAYIAHHVLQLQPSVDMVRFKAAVERVAAANPVLRTRLVSVNNKIVQAVIRGGLDWFSADDVTTYIGADRKRPAEFGGPMIRLGLVRHQDHFELIFTAHHAVYDGWSIPLILEQVEKAYTNAFVAPSITFRSFIAKLMETDRELSARYWSAQLQDFESMTFPPVPSSSREPRADRVLVHRCSFTRPPRTDITSATFIRAAWSILVGQHCLTDDVVIGTTLSGRAIPLPGIDEVVGPTIATVPVRVRLVPSQTVENFLRQLQDQSTEMIPHEQFGLRNISRLGAGADAACNFQSLLVVQPAVTLREGAAFQPDELRVVEEVRSYALTMQVRVEESELSLTANYDPVLLDGQYVTWLLHQMEHVVQRLLADPLALLQDVKAFGDRDAAQIAQWSPGPPEFVDRCVHEVFEDRVRESPNKVAVQAWDGDVTYAELDEMSSRLAWHLSQLGVVAETTVPILSEKSLWTQVALLGAIKAGGTFVLLDPDHPPARLQGIVADVEAKFILSSVQYASLAQSLGSLRVVVVGESMIAGLPKDHEGLPPSGVTPRHALYIHFSSGTTGKPKGSIIEHCSYSSSAAATCRAMDLSPDPDSANRVLHFASHSYDQCIGEMLGTIMHGGCLCIPSDFERNNDVVGAINKYHCTRATFTPSFGRLVSPADVPCLRVVVVGGEAMAEQDVEHWQGVQLFNAYGPSETTVSSCIKRSPGIDGSDHRSIGHGIEATRYYITEPGNPEQRAPLGGLGEIVIDGPTVAREYLKEPEKSKAAFVDRPGWLRDLHSAVPAGRKLYRTGDMARYASNGEIIFLGRQDTQVKLRSQRLELGEVDHHISRLLPASAEVVSDVVVSATSSTPMLAAFIRLKNNAPLEEGNASLLDGDAAMSSEWAALRDRIDGQLAKLLPGYMIPSVYVPLKRLPFTRSHKVERKQLRALIAAFSADQLATFSQAARHKRLPTNAMERQMRAQWALVLGMEAESVSIDDNFFRLGGDSIDAMKLVATVRAQGVHLTMAIVFQHPRLMDMCLAATTGSTMGRGDDVIPPFSLVEAALLDGLRQEACRQCRISPALIDDIYPCTPLQEGMLAVSMKRPGMEMAQMSFTLPTRVNLDRFRRSWEAAVRRNAILRTRLISTEDGAFQVVTSEQVEWTSAYGLQEYLRCDRAQPMADGDRLTRFALVADGGESNETHCVLTVHHALYDGWSWALLERAVEDAYSGEPPLKAPPFNRFVRYLQHQARDEAGVKFWKDELSDCDVAVFPALPAAGHEPTADAFIQRHVELAPSAITTATLLRAAWALVVSAHTGRNDVVFGATVTGRTAPITGIEQMLGPTFVTVPFRVRVDRTETPASFLQRVQEQAGAMQPYEHVGLPAIARASAAAAEACKFQNVLVVQAGAGEEDLHRADGGGVLGERKDRDAGLGTFNNYALMFECAPCRGGVTINASFDPRLLNHVQMRRVIDQFAHTTHELLRHASAADTHPIQIQALDLVSPEDYAEIAEWNRCPPPVIERRVHDIIGQRVAATPDAEAVCAWDGSLTYRQLDDYAGRVAVKLRELGASAGGIVPVAFEKSMWAVVAMLAVLKSGAAFALLDPVQHHASRVQELAAQVSAKVVVCSPAHANIFEGHVDRIIQVSPSTVNRLPTGQTSNDTCTPDDFACVMFTSGSTGTPKAILHNHSGLASSFEAFGPCLNVNPGSRVFQFAAYAFDASVGDNLATLMQGGCVCVPSDADRMGDFAGAFARLRANYVHVTPSLGRQLEPDELPGLRTLMLGGEMLQQTELRRWAHRARLITAYGPAESSLCVAGTLAPGVREPPNLGFPVGCRLWVADAEDCTRLAPVGVVGQLVVEGPVNAAGGYLNDAERTAKSFLLPGSDRYTRWAPGNGITATQRMFRTGDLVRYASDGTVEFVERADTQIKLRGQRVEVAEVECAMLEALGAAGFHDDSAIGQLSPTDGASVLAAFLCFDGRKASPDVLQRLLSAITTALSGRLLPYMIPTVIVPIDTMPRTASNKIDRKQLRAIGAALTPDQLASFSRLDGRAGRRPATSPEKTLCMLVARALGVSEDQVYADDVFARLGGDSIQGMRLVATAREYGLSFTVADLFKAPDIAALAKQSATELAAADPAAVKSTTTMDRRRSSGFTRRFMFEVVARAQGWDAHKIRDLYPCTPLQEGLMSLSLERHGAYVSHNVFELPAGLDAERFRSAWARVVADNPILRTRIVQLEGSGATVQVVLDEPPQWEIDEGASLAQVIEQERSIKTELGAPLNRWHEVVEPGSGKRWLVWTAHHSTYDGWSMKLVIEQVEAAYRGGSVNHPLLSPRPAFRQFVSDVEATAERSRVFWAKAFEGQALTTFPPPSGPGYRPRVTRFESRKVDICRKKASGITTPTLIRAAWALLLQQHSDGEDADGRSAVLFGTVSSGRSSSSLPGIERVVGPTMCALPAAVHVDESQSVGRYLDSVQTAWLEALPHEHFGLQNLARLGGGARSACAFGNLLVVQPRELRDATNSEVMGHWQDSENETGFFSYTLTCQCSLDDSGADVMLGWDDNIIPPHRGAWLLRQFVHLVSLLAEAEADNCNQPLADLAATGPADWDQLRLWNELAHSLQAAPSPENSMCVSDRMSARARAEADRQAICSWEGDFSYLEVDELSDRLALHLVGLGVTHGTLVPFCFDKSAWAIISVLAVLKAGGAFVPLDPSYPRVWLQDVVDQTRAKVIVASPGRGALCASLGARAVEVSAALLDSIPTPNGGFHSQAQLNSTACVIFTSGSTGRPKGVVTTHASLSRGATDHGQALRINRDARVLHFASYVFDASIMEMLTTLSHGGCVCVPSPEERATDITAAMARTSANWALFTPSFARTLDPGKVCRQLRTLVVGGEAAAPDTLATWADRLHLINAYGPAENCVITSVAAGLRPSDHADRIGRPVSGRCWVVRPQSGKSRDRLALAPLGAVGELVVEAETLAQGYLNEPEKTAEAFVANAGWAEAAGKRLYRTGDLVRYDADGSLCYVGRKDSMIKLRGQRMELSPIEALIRQEISAVGVEAKAVAVDQITAPGRPGAQLLAAFLGLAAQEEEPRVLDLTEHIRTAFVSLQARLAKQLPAHMVPTMFVPLTQIPLTLAGKTDRKRLRTLATDLSAQQAAHCCLTVSSAANTPRAPPTTPAERILHALWIEVLRLPADAVGKEDGFFQLGGDSISAMRLATLAREREGLRLTVASIFTNTTLADMAKAARPLDDALECADEQQNGNGALSSPDAPLREAIAKAVSQRFDDGDIEDVVAATDYQAWTWAATNLRSRGYNNYLMLRGKEGYSLAPDRMAAACRALVRRHQILRTVFVPHEQALLQVAIRADSGATLELVEEICEGDEKEVVDRDMQTPRSLSSSPVHFFVTKAGGLVIRIAHALYDGISLPVLLRDLKAAYDNEPSNPPSVPFTHYVRILHQRDSSAAERHWRNLLLDSSGITEVVAGGSAPSHKHLMASSESALAHPNAAALSRSGATAASLVKAAWAATLAQLSGGDEADITFGSVTAGRSDAQLHQDAVGPCMNILPVRARVGLQTRARELVGRVHDQHVAGLPHEWLGCRQIIARCSGWPRWARWSSVVQHNNFAVTLDRAVAGPAESGRSKPGEPDWQLESFAPAHDVADVWIMSKPVPEAGALRVEINFCKEALGETIAQQMLGLLCKNVESLAEALAEGAEEVLVLSRGSEGMPVIPVPIAATETANAVCVSEGEEDPAMFEKAQAIVERAWGEVFPASAHAEDMQVSPEDIAFYELWGEAVLAAAHLRDVYHRATHGPLELAVEDLMDAPTRRAQIALILEKLRSMDAA